MVISPTTLATASGCALDGLAINKDWEKKITQETMDKLRYGKSCLDEGEKKALNTFLRTTNLTYLCRMIYNVLFNIVMPGVGSRDYVNDKHYFCIYKIMVGEKVNLPSRTGSIPR